MNCRIKNIMKKVQVRLCVAGITIIIMGSWAIAQGIGH